MEREILSAIGEVDYHENPTNPGVWDIFIPDIIVTGGQSGSDLGGLKGAVRVGIPTAGIAPKGWRTEAGPRPELGTVYGLAESKSDDYAVRTRENIALADVVILIAGDFFSAGSHLTKKLAVEAQLPVFEVPYPRLPSLENPFLVEDMRTWLDMHKPGVVMIAGNRESKARGIERWTSDLVYRLFTLTFGRPW